MVRYGAAGRVPGDEHAAEVGGLGEPPSVAVAVAVDGAFPEPVEARRVVDRGGEAVLGARRYPAESTTAAASAARRRQKEWTLAHVHEPRQNPPPWK